MLSETTDADIEAILDGKMTAPSPDESQDDPTPPSDEPTPPPAPTADPKPADTETIEQLQARIEKLKQDKKDGFKKSQELRNNLKTNYVSKDEVEALLSKRDAEREEKMSLVDKYPDARDSISEIEKIKAEKNLSYDEAYSLYKGKLWTDPGFRAQQQAVRGGLHGDFYENTASQFDQIFAQGPAVSTPMK